MLYTYPNKLKICDIKLMSDVQIPVEAPPAPELISVTLLTNQYRFKAGH